MSSPSQLYSRGDAMIRLESCRKSVVQNALAAKLQLADAQEKESHEVKRATRERHVDLCS